MTTARRALTVAGLFLTGAVAVAQFPPADPGPLPIPRKLPTAADATDIRREAAREVEAGKLAADRVALQAQLRELLKKIEDRPVAPPRPVVSVTPPRPKFEFGEGRPVDSLRLAMNLFADNDFDAALRAFRLVDVSQLGREDRTFVQYMIGCCLRRTNRRAEAAAVYREVSEAKDDEFVSECAIWQLSLIQATRDLGEQLEQIRSRTAAK